MESVCILIISFSYTSIYCVYFSETQMWVKTFNEIWLSMHIVTVRLCLYYYEQNLTVSPDIQNVLHGMPIGKSEDTDILSSCYRSVTCGIKTSSE